MRSLLKSLTFAVLISTVSLPLANATDQVFTNLVDALKQSDKVLVLNLSERGSDQDIAQIHEFNSLKQLVLNGVAAEQGILDSKELASLEIFGILSGTTSRLPLSLGLCTNLRILVVRNTPVVIRSDDIVNLTKLELLFVMQCELREFPEGLGQLQLLRDVNLSDNDLEAIPVDLFEAPSLSSLNLSRNRLKILPVHIGQSRNLKGLALEENLLKSLPDEIGDLLKLESLYVFGNQIVRLPDSIGGLENLRVLNAQNNSIIKIPRTVRLLQHLQVLHLDNNELQALPSEIGELKSLRTLTLSGNKLNSLPASISKLSRLRLLDLSNNPIAELPSTFGELVSLRRLILSSAISVAEQERIRLLLPNCEVIIADQGRESALPRPIGVRVPGKSQRLILI